MQSIFMCPPPPFNKTLTYFINVLWDAVPSVEVTGVFVVEFVLWTGVIAVVDLSGAVKDEC